MTHGLISQTIVYLGAAVVAVPISKRLGLGSVIGYLISGLVIGPFGAGLIPSSDDVLQFSELGVVFLLFLIGLELNPRRLWQLRKPIFGMGGIQVVICAAIFAAMGWIAGQKISTGLVAGMGFAMSSTALALQLLREKKLLDLPPGQASFSVLLFQDLAVIPMLAILPLLAASTVVDTAALSTDGSWLPTLKGALAILGVVFAGRFLIRPIFRFIATTDIREIFTAFALLLTLGIAALMQSVGLSMALGSFLAGLLLADSEYRHELEIDIEPFKGLLLGLFFIAVGMSMDIRILVNSAYSVLILVALILAVKLAVLYGLARTFRYNSTESALFALSLSQGGEFAFVLFGSATQLGALGAGEAAILNLAVALSMMSTPFLFIVYERWILPRLEAKASASKAAYEVHDQGSSVILAGYGRIGQVVGRLLHAQKIGLTILEQDPSQIEVVRRFGWKTFYGDVSRLDLLEAAGARRAKLLILAIDDMDATRRTIEIVRRHFPDLKILVRAESRLDAYDFFNDGVPTVRSTLSPGLEMAEEALKLLNRHPYEARVITQNFKRYDRIRFEQTAKHSHDEKTMVSLSLQSREELIRIMETDEKRRGEAIDQNWAGNLL